MFDLQYQAISSRVYDDDEFIDTAKLNRSRFDHQTQLQVEGKA